MKIGAHYAFRVTRNADSTSKSFDADDLLAAVEIELRRRRFGHAVRLEIDPDLAGHARTPPRRARARRERRLRARTSPSISRSCSVITSMDRPD